MNIKNNYKCITDASNVKVYNYVSLINIFEKSMNMYLSSPSLKNIKMNFWKNKERDFFKNNNLNVAVHIRRENKYDITLDPSRICPLVYYFNLINNIREKYKNNEKKIIDNVNFEFYKNECVCILGKNGSGKSTFLNLIAGLIKPTEGEVIVDNAFDLYSNRSQWIDKLSYVQQNIFLLDASIKNNITLENNDSKIDYIKYNKVLDILRLEDSFINFPNKYPSFWDKPLLKM
jgi:ABC-type multidrug transport system fused ATPase/permease subunit